MKQLLLILSVCSALAVHAAIKRDPSVRQEKEETPSAEKPQKRKGGLLQELLKRGSQGGKFDPNPAELEQLLRDLLAEEGVPKEELKGANLLELLRKLRELDPESMPFWDGLSGFMDSPEQKKLGDHFKGLLEGHKPGTAVATRATFTLSDAKRPAHPLAFASGVNAGGWVLTKASEVRSASQLQAEVKGRKVAAKVAKVWEDHDLALVKLEAQDIPALNWSGKMPVVGGFITAAAPDGRDPVAIGVVSVGARNLQEKGRGFLGLGLESDEQGLKVSTLSPEGAAKGAGVQLNDYVLEFDGQKPDSFFAFTKLVMDRKPGDKVKLKLKRGSETIEKEVQLGDRARAVGMRGQRPGLDRMNSMGSTISKRRADFPSVVQTDFPLEANECGGPVTDLDGNVVGMVIARSGRIETLVLPSEVIAKALSEVDFAKEEANLTK